MSTCFGLGAISSLEADTPRDIALGVLKRIAAFSGAPIRDVVEGEVIEVSPDGSASEVDAGIAARISEGIKRVGSASSRAFQYLDGFDIVVPGDFEGDLLDDLPGDNELNVHPIREFRGRLEELLAQEQLDPSSQSLHRTLRGLCDIAEELRVPLSIAS